MLQPVVEAYCKGELLWHTTDFACEIDKMNRNGNFQNSCAISSLDVDALYPNSAVPYVFQLDFCAEIDFIG